MKRCPNSLVNEADTARFCPGARPVPLQLIHKQSGEFVFNAHDKGNIHVFKHMKGNAMPIV